MSGKKTIDCSDNYYNDNYEDNYSWAYRNTFSLIIVCAVILSTVIMMLVITAGVDKIEKWDNFLETSTCQEIDTYLIDHVRDIGVGSGLSDLRADKYAQVEKLKELKCK